MIPFTSTPRSWNELVASLPLAHLLQTWEWSQFKVQHGWQPMPLVWQDATEKPVAAAMVLKRALPMIGAAVKMCILYVPRGPLMDWQDAALRRRVLEDLQTLAKRQGAIFIKIDPDVPLGTGVPGTEDAVEFIEGQTVCSELQEYGWQFSKDQIQSRNTILIDLTPSEDELLNAMKQKTRYNVHLSQKKGVMIRAGTLNDLSLLYRMYQETAERDDFSIPNEDYFQTLWHSFMGIDPDASGLQPFMENLVAEVDGDPVGAISLFFFAGQALYYLGMSRGIHREKMPTYLLQWEAMRRSKALDCKIYDLWGVCNEFSESDKSWNLFRFKKGLGGVVSRTIGAWDFTPNRILYKMYFKALPFMDGIMQVAARIAPGHHILI